MLKAVLCISLLPFIIGAQTSRPKPLPKVITEVANSYAKRQIRKLGLAKGPCYRYINKQRNFNWLCLGEEENWLLRAEKIFIHIAFKRSNNKKHFCLIDERNKKKRHLDCYTVCINQISHKIPDRCYQNHDDVEEAILDIVNFRRTKNFRNMLIERFGEGYSVR